MSELDCFDGPTDTVHKDKDKWWFWDETWEYRYGPFETEEEAIEECTKYGKFLSRE